MQKKTVLNETPLIKWSLIILRLALSRLLGFPRSSLSKEKPPTCWQKPLVNSMGKTSLGQRRAAFDFLRATSAQVQEALAQARSFLAVKLDKSFLPQARQNVCPSKDIETRVARQPHTCVQWNFFLFACYSAFHQGHVAGRPRLHLSEPCRCC